MKSYCIIHYLAVAVFLLIATQSSFSQKPSIALGITGGHLNAENDAKYVYICSTCGKSMGNFNAGTYFAGISFEYLLDIGIEGSIMSKIYYNSFSNIYSVDGVSFPNLVDASDPNYTPLVVRSVTHNDWEVNYSLLTLDILPKIKIPYLTLDLFAGISVSYLLDSRFSEIYRIISPQNVRFPEYPEYKGMYEDKGRSIRFKDGVIPFKNDYRYGFKAGMQYDFDFWGLRLSPFVAIDIPFNSVVNGVNLNCPPLACSTRTDAHWKITYYQAGLDLKYLF